VEGKDSCCVYPASRVLQSVVSNSRYEGRPFTKRLFLGEAQLTPVFFDLDVLEKYSRDPRYSFEFHDYSGSISISDSHYSSTTVRDRDKVLLATFGIGYDANRHRVVIAYLRYLSDLSPEHQQIWNAHILNEPCVMNSDYARATIYGAWPQHRSAYEALLAEQEEINKLSEMIGKPRLFRETYSEARRPAEFRPMLRPTKRNFDDFVHLLDKMVSENINKDFFRGDIALETRQTIDEETVVTPKGTLTLLQQWFDTRYRTADGRRVGKEVTEALKKVRGLRQTPAHRVTGDEFDPNLPKQQDELVAAVIRSLMSIRLILSAHPLARGRYEPPDWLDSSTIVFY
jgi:hypothetical protein